MVRSSTVRCSKDAGRFIERTLPPRSNFSRSTMRVRRSLLVGLGAGAAMLASAGQARAWYFPEHMTIAHDAIVLLPPEIRDVLRDAVARGRADGLALCADVDLS